jgi:RNA polymerase sigma factor (sigma-70 family)
LSEVALEPDDHTDLDDTFVASAAVPPAFEDFAAEILPRVFRLAGRMGVYGADRDDLAAEALARVYASWGRVGQLDRRDGWVLRTTANLAYDRGRRLARRAGPTPSVAVPGFEHQIVERSALIDGLKALSARQRQAVVLHHMAGLSVDEVAASLRASPNSVKKHLQRGMQSLRAQLVNRLDEEGFDVRR